MVFRCPQKKEQVMGKKNAKYLAALDSVKRMIKSSGGVGELFF